MGKFVKGVNANTFKKMMIGNIVSSLLWLISGLIMLFMPGLTNKIIGLVIGCIFLLSGVSTIYKFLKRDGAKLYSLNLVFGIIAAVLGIVIILSPFSVSSFITVCMGLYLIVIGSNKVTYGIWFKIGNDPAWLITLVIGLMICMFGVLLLVNPFAALTITKLIGTFLIISSILDITNTVLIYKRSEEIVKIFW